MSLPAFLRQRMTGQALAVSRNVTVSRGDLSVIGAKTVVFSDSPAFYLHDAGGIFASEQVLTQDSAQFHHAHLVLIERSRVLYGELEFRDGVSTVVRFEVQVERLVDSLAAQRSHEPGSVFAKPLEVSIRCRFVANTSEIQDHIRTTAPGLHEYLSTQEIFKLMPPGKSLDSSSELGHADCQALLEYLNHREFYAQIVVVGSRLQLHRQGQILADVPLDRVPLPSTPETEVVLPGEFIVAGFPARELTIYLSGPSQARRFAEGVRQRQNTASGAAITPARTGVLDVVQVQGQLSDGQTIDQRLDALVSEDMLELRTMESGRLLGQFRFADPDVVVAGTVERFIVASDRVGPLVVSGGSEGFRKRFLGHRPVQAAAQRTARTGPFPVFLGDEPVICRVGNEGLELVGALGRQRIAYGELRTIQRETFAGQEALTLGPDRKLVGTREILKSLMADLGAQCCARDYAQRPRELLAQVMRLEGDYLIYALCGPIYEVHALLTRQSGQKIPTGPVQVPDDTSERLALAVGMAQGVESLKVYLDQLLYLFPAQLTQWDGSFGPLEGLPPQEFKMLERGCLGALMGLQPALGEVRQIREILLRVDGIEERLARETNLDSAVFSTLLGFVFNPLYLINAVREAMSSAQGSERQKAEHANQARQAIARAVQQWNYLVLELLPALWHHVLDGLFPLRLRFYQHVRPTLEQPHCETSPRILRRLAQRYAQLATLAQFPVNDAAEATRADVVELARSIQKRLTTTAFPNF